MNTDCHSHMKILIVDDEPANVRLLERILELDGCTNVRGISDSRLTLGIYEEFKPDIVLLDLNMPHHDGFAIMQMLKTVVEEDEYLPILVLTADISTETRLRALANGAKDFVNKPIDRTEVVLRIKNLVETRALHLGVKKQNARLEEVVLERTSSLESALEELKSTQEQIVKQERLRALGMMAGGIAHDFNNALTMMLGYGELLLPWLHENGSPRETAYLNHIIASAQDATQVVSRLREFYRPAENNEIRVPVDLKKVALQAVALTTPKWKAKCLADGVQIDVETTLDDVGLVAANASEIREVLTNLIFNAVDALPTGGKIIVGTASTLEGVSLTVTDTGIGMTESERVQCLEPFFTTKGEKGTGLGLSVVYGIVHRHGGKIGIFSKKGVGTTFKIDFPITEGAEFVEAVALDHISDPLHVLIVDDQEIICELIAEHLSADGHFTTITANGHQALQAFADGHFDLVITDQSMPLMSGVQLATAIKKISPQTPVVLLTGFGDEMIAHGNRPVGIDLVLSKPVSLTELRDAVFQSTRKPELLASVA